RPASTPSPPAASAARSRPAAAEPPALARAAECLYHYALLGIMERAWRLRMRRAMWVAFLVMTLALGQAVSAQSPAPAGAPTVIVSTTTSTQDSGLLDVLVPLFEQQTGYSVKTISVGTGQALALAARGEADVTLAHAPAAEKKYVAEGKMHNRRLVMYNDFLL